MSDRSNLGIAIKRVTINDASQLPKDYCQTPMGTIFSTTPGGTRIIYDKQFLLSRKDSPLAKSPPPNMPYIPEVTLIAPKENNNNNNNNNSKCTECVDHTKNNDKNNQTIQNNPKKDVPDNMQFEMDI